MNSQKDLGENYIKSLPKPVKKDGRKTPTPMPAPAPPPLITSPNGMSQGWPALGIKGSRMNRFQ